MRTISNTLPDAVTHYHNVLNLIRDYCDRGMDPPRALIYAVYADALQGGLDGVTLLYATLLEYYPDLIRHFDKIPYLHIEQEDEPGPPPIAPEGSHMDGMSTPAMQGPGHTEIMYR